MDTYKRSIRGLQSRSNGEHFEGMIIAASRFYEERGIAAVDKTPEAFKVLKAMDRNRGQFICCFTKQAQPDFKGILMDSTMILFDAKHTDKDKISRDVVTTEQQACFERYMKLGAMCFWLYLWNLKNSTGLVGGISGYEEDLRTQVHEPGRTGTLQDQIFKRSGEVPRWYCSPGKE